VVFQYEYLLIFFFVLSCHLYLEHENIQGVKRIFDIYKIKLNNTLHMCKICKTYKVIKIPFVEHQEFERKKLHHGLMTRSRLNGDNFDY
jgi:hypothetical protein